MQTSIRLIGVWVVTLACSAPEPEPPVPIEHGGSCDATFACAKDLHCTQGRCTPPSTDQEKRAVKVAGLQRKIADTKRYEAKAYTEDGKRRMQKERAKLEAELAELGAGGTPD